MFPVQERCKAPELCHMRLCTLMPKLVYEYEIFNFNVVIVIFKVQLNRYHVMLVILYEHGQDPALQYRLSISRPLAGPVAPRMN